MTDRTDKAKIQTSRAGDQTDKYSHKLKDGAASLERLCSQHCLGSQVSQPQKITVNAVIKRDVPPLSFFFFYFKVFIEFVTILLLFYVLGFFG